MELAITQPVTLPLTLTDTAGNNVNIIVRQKDGYVDATLLCQAMGKQWKVYYNTQNNKRYLETLAEFEQCLAVADTTATTADEPRAKCLVELGKNRFQHTWLVRKELKGLEDFD